MRFDLQLARAGLVEVASESLFLLALRRALRDRLGRRRHALEQEVGFANRLQLGCHAGVDVSSELLGVQQPRHALHTKK